MTPPCSACRQMSPPISARRTRAFEIAAHTSPHRPGGLAIRTDGDDLLAVDEHVGLEAVGRCNDGAAGDERLPHRPPPSCLPRWRGGDATANVSRLMVRRAETHRLPAMDVNGYT